MTLQIELTAEQEAVLTAQAARDAKTVSEVLLERAFQTSVSEDGDQEQSEEIARRKIAWAEIDRRRQEHVTPPHLYDVKMDAEFFYTE